MLPQIEFDFNPAVSHSATISCILIDFNPDCVDASLPCSGASPGTTLGLIRGTLTRRVSMEEGAGEVCGELLCPYPPGIPLLFPGERISGAALALLAEVQRQGGRVVGASDPQLRSVLVCD
mmetsp:Transcript_47305/g.120721  ORF Transcript_47305/g.120721 Transcript_47305/m.120721 type:complete len:121 (+) Transcript_47305:54-416(+)